MCNRKITKFKLRDKNFVYKKEMETQLEIKLIDMLKFAFFHCILADLTK